LTYIAPAYYANRGSTRFKILSKIGFTTGTGQAAINFPVVATRDFSRAWAIFTASTNDYAASSATAGGSFQGTSIIRQDVGGPLQVESLQYIRDLFSRVVDLVGGGTRLYNGIWVSSANVAANSTTFPQVWEVHQAAADDFTFDFYVGPPTMINVLVQTGV